MFTRSPNCRLLPARRPANAKSPPAARPRQRLPPLVGPPGRRLLGQRLFSRQPAPAHRAMLNQGHLSQDLPALAQHGKAAGSGAGWEVRPACLGPAAGRTVGRGRPGTSGASGPSLHIEHAHSSICCAALPAPPTDLHAQTWGSWRCRLRASASGIAACATTAAATAAQGRCSHCWPESASSCCAGSGKEGRGEGVKGRPLLLPQGGGVAGARRRGSAAAPARPGSSPKACLAKKPAHQKPARASKHHDSQSEPQGRAAGPGLLSPPNPPGAPARCRCQCPFARSLAVRRSGCRQEARHRWGVGLCAGRVWGSQPVLSSLTPSSASLLSSPSPLSSLTSPLPSLPDFFFLPLPRATFPLASRLVFGPPTNWFGK